MSALGNRTAILTLSRIANYGLMLISPVFLVRLLSVADFGRYREFLLYGSILQAFAQFSINDSLLYCVPANPASPWRVARQTAILTLCSSSLVVLVLMVLDTATGGAIVHGYLWPLVAYVLVSVNLDFWEHFWLANNRAQAVFVYSGARLAIRVLVVVVTAALTHDFRSVIWALVPVTGIPRIVFWPSGSSSPAAFSYARQSCGRSNVRNRVIDRGNTRRPYPPTVFRATGRGYTLTVRAVLSRTNAI